jgi:hypothetical protein
MPLLGVIPVVESPFTFRSNLRAWFPLKPVLEVRDPQCMRELADGGLRSIVNWLNIKSLKSLKAVLHGLQRFRGMSLPLRDLAHDS